MHIHESKLGPRVQNDLLSFAEYARLAARQIRVRSLLYSVAYIVEQVCVNAPYMNRTNRSMLLSCIGD